MALAHDHHRPTIVLVHGFGGFDRIGPLSFGIRYFRGVAARFRTLGFPCATAPTLPSQLPMTARVDRLASFLESGTTGDIILIGHSLGGLDCRFMLHRHASARRVRALVTLGTPHHGTPFAEWALRSGALLPRIARLLGEAALHELTPAACLRRNEEIDDPSGIACLSVAGCRPALELASLPMRFLPELFPPDEPNDGLVAVSSATWGEFVGTVPADHLELVGWSLWPARLPPGAASGSHRRARFDHLSLYEDLIHTLAGTFDIGRHARCSSPGTEHE